jgi:regulator of sigma E protease
MSIIVFLIVLALLVLVHEFGHFFAAKKSGIRVDEFGLGFPPRLFGKKVGETTYTLNLIPFGGFVKIFGENAEEHIEGADKERSFIYKSKPIQALVLVAGIICNFLFAWLLITVAFMIGAAASPAEYPQYANRFENARVMITSVTAGSPAQSAGLKAGDSIDRVTVGKASVSGNVPIESIQELVAKSAGNDVTVRYTRGNEHGLIAHAVATTTIVEGRYAIGIVMDEVGELSLPLHLALWEGLKLTIHLIGAVAMGLVDFISSAFVGTADFAAVSGPVGIVGLVGDATRLGFAYLLMFTAVISINLGVINLVPFPALDGGRLLFVAIEAIIRRPISPKIANTLNTIGFVLLLLLMVVITYKDIVKLI